MYLFPKTDNLKLLLSNVEEQIKTSKHSLLSKMLIKKADILKKRIKTYTFYKEKEEEKFDESSADWEIDSNMSEEQLTKEEFAELDVKYEKMMAEKKEKEDKEKARKEKVVAKEREDKKKTKEKK